MFAHLLPALCASVLGAAGCQQDRPTGVPVARPQADVTQPRDTVLAPAADPYIRRLAPNQNQGAEPVLRLTALGKNRALLRWDQQALLQAVGGGTVTAARLELERILGAHVFLELFVKVDPNWTRSLHKLQEMGL